MVVVLVIVSIMKTIDALNTLNGMCAELKGARMSNKDTGIVNIHGKEYQTVAHRVNKFRADYTGHSIMTEIIESNDKAVIMKASITDENNYVIATGHAEEVRGSTNINKTSALENCETSAIGRALACFGLLGTEFASADEVQHAITNKKSYPKTLSKEDLATRFQECKHIKELENAYKKYKDDINALPEAQAKAILKLVADCKKAFQDGAL